MVDAISLRARFLTILGAGLLSVAPACGGTAVQRGEAGGGAGGSTPDNASGAGGQGAFPAIAGDGGGGLEPATAGGAGFVGYPPSCANEDLCYTEAQLEMMMIDSSGGAAGSAGADQSGAAGSSPFVCPTLNSTKYKLDADIAQEAPLMSFQTSDGSCCYVYWACHSGRPFTVDGTARSARLAARRDWADDRATIDSSDLGSDARAVLAKAWLDDALAEHASVASFARLTLELLQHAAPSELIWASQLASLDEVEHARSCFALAERYSNAAHGPGSFPMDSALGPVTLSQLATRTALEGCVGETLAALVAAEQARAATDPWARTVLQKIAEDEARHAEFAWRVLRWAIGVGGSDVRRAVQAAFESVCTSSRTPVFAAPAAHDAQMRAHGRLSETERAAIIAQAVREVVVPCAEALFVAPRHSEQQCLTFGEG